MRFVRRILPLLLALLLLVPAALADKTLDQLADRLLEQQLILDEVSADLSKLTQKYERDPDDAALQDKLIDVMIAYEEAEQSLASTQAEHRAHLLNQDDCETYTLEHDGEYAGLTIQITVDEDLTIWDLTCAVDGSERDQAVGENAFLYQFFGKTLPVTMGNGKKDDVRPADGAATTSEEFADALNSLVYAAPDEPEGPITDPQGIADYIFRHGELPDNFITKKEAQRLGWDSSYNYVGAVAPGKSIGGDRFGNYEGRLPSKKGRTWYEADCYYEGRKRNAHRILFSNDGLVYYTDDHYETFTQMFPSWE